MESFSTQVTHVPGKTLAPCSIDVVQINLGLLCNLSCRHCHVEASPNRSEIMQRQTMQHILDTLPSINPRYIDITGGAPELVPDFKWFLEKLHSQGHPIQVRTNLTILTKEPYKHLIPFYKNHNITLVASLPCYTADNVKKQRGVHTFEQSIKVLKQLNSVGYATPGGPKIHLVYNPGGPSLPGDQQSLERDYKKVLFEEFDIAFNKLLTITNMALGRFKDDLQRSGRYDEYMKTLKTAFNPSTIDGLMCKNQIHISYDGSIYDCDFNYALGLPSQVPGKPHITSIDIHSFLKRTIKTADHCYACTAGNGSSCSGAIS